MDVPYLYYRWYENITVLNLFKTPETSQISIEMSKIIDNKLNAIRYRKTSYPAKNTEKEKHKDKHQSFLHRTVHRTPLTWTNVRKRKKLSEVVPQIRIHLMRDGTRRF